jgi:hypothetical protein
LSHLSLQTCKKCEQEKREKGRVRFGNPFAGVLGGVMSNAKLDIPTDWTCRAASIGTSAATPNPGQNPV